MKKTYLGEFEEVILLTVALLNGQAYGVAITEALEEQTGRSASISAVHATLHRLQDKGFVKSYMGGATAAEGKGSLLSRLPVVVPCMRSNRYENNSGNRFQSGHCNGK